MPSLRTNSFDRFQSRVKNTTLFSVLSVHGVMIETVWTAFPGGKDTGRLRKLHDPSSPY